MKVTYGGTTYECNVAVKCECDKYIKLYDENSVEIAAFYGITDFDQYTISQGAFVDAADSDYPIPLTTYKIGGRKISEDDWIPSDSGQYFYEIYNKLISANETTCNVFLFFAAGTNFSYTATQEDGKLILRTRTIPQNEVIIKSIHITRV